MVKRVVVVKNGRPCPNDARCIVFSTGDGGGSSGGGSGGSGGCGCGCGRVLMR